MKTALATLLVMVAACGVAAADTVSVSISGNVTSNFLSTPPLNAVQINDGVVMSFNVDSNLFLNGGVANTRGYFIDPSSFELSFDTPASVGLLNPFPAGQAAYFTLADGIPVSDRFWVSTSVLSPGGVPISQTPLNANVDLGYVGGTLSSLDILDAIGTYNFTGLTSFGFTLWSGSPDNSAMDIEFKSMTITPEPATLALLATGVLALRRRRR